MSDDGKWRLDKARDDGRRWMWRKQKQDYRPRGTLSDGSTIPRFFVYLDTEGSEAWGNCIGLSPTVSPYSELCPATCIAEVTKFVRSGDKQP